MRRRRRRRRREKRKGGRKEREKRKKTFFGITKCDNYFKALPFLVEIISRRFSTTLYNLFHQKSTSFKRTKVK
jgi:hypothetical protein